MKSNKYSKELRHTFIGVEIFSILTALISLIFVMKGYYIFIITLGIGIGTGVFICIDYLKFLKNRKEE